MFLLVNTNGMAMVSQQPITSSSSKQHLAKEVVVEVNNYLLFVQTQQARGGQGQGGAIASLTHEMGDVQLELQRQRVQSIVVFHRFLLQSPPRS